MRREPAEPAEAIPTNHCVNGYSTTVVWPVDAPLKGHTVRVTDVSPVAGS